MSGAHKRTTGEIESQTKQRRRRYAASVGKGYCELSRKGFMCPDLAVKQLAGIDVCAFHVDLIESIRLDSRARVSAAA